VVACRYDIHDQSYPNNRLGLFKFKAIGVQSGYTRYEYTSPAKGEAHVGVDMNLLEKIGSGKVLLGWVRITLFGDSAASEMTIRTRLTASSRAFLSSVGLALLTLTTSRLWLGVGGMGNMERGGGVAVESDGTSAVGAGLIPLAAFLPRAMFDMIVMGRREKWRELRRGGRGGERNRGKENV
jgi:hypothetical protein